jgi:hypothetical protein
MTDQGKVITERPFKLGAGIEWLEDEDLWKLDIADDPYIAAVLIAGDDIRNAVETDSHNPSLLEALIRDHADDIEEMIAVAEIEHWEPDMGVIPLCHVPQSIGRLN